MDYYDGETLRKKLEKGKLTTDELVNIAIQIAQGLAEAHEAGIIHRDIKPANILVTRKGDVKILDFGLAKLSGQTLHTKTGSTLGTVSYMSPEQARGGDVDHRTDIWSLGIVLYQMLTGELPFKGDYDAVIIHNIILMEPESIQKYLPDISPELLNIVNRALEKKPGDRYQSVNDLLIILKKIQKNLFTEKSTFLDYKYFLSKLKKPQIFVPTLSFMVLLSIIVFYYINHTKKVRWALEVILPEIEILVENNEFPAALKKATQAEKYISNNPLLTKLIKTISRSVAFETTPSGADVFILDYFNLDDWHHVGRTPLKKVNVAFGVLRWKVLKKGYDPLFGGITTLYDPDSTLKISVTLRTEGTIPFGMVLVEGFNFENGMNVPEYYLDRYEVTNKQFKEFLDKGGYKKPEYWSNKFINKREVLSWKSAMKEFIDATGMPGPRFWEFGEYPEGRDNFPVTGVSWYEARAYATFCGKTLPTVRHWFQASGRNQELRGDLLRLSNFNGKRIAPVGEYKGRGSFDTFDMAGNVSEWCFNSSNNTNSDRICCGGSSDEPQYMFFNLKPLPSFSRLPNLGFRCMKSIGNDSINSELTRPIKSRLRYDHSKEIPVSDEIFNSIISNYSIHQVDLESSIVNIDTSFNYWKLEKVLINTYYGGERMPVYIFVPKNVNPPYQTVIYYPGDDARLLDSLQYYQKYWYDFLIKSGRTVVFPVYQDMFERRILEPRRKRSISTKDFKIYWFKDFVATIDYLETRPEFDKKKLAFYGFSRGAESGPIFVSLDKRIQLSIWQSGGLLNRKYLPEINPLNFAPRVKIPVLMLNGRYDSKFDVESQQKPLFLSLGTPVKDKIHLIYESGHPLWPLRDWMMDILSWLDKYWGSVE
jgi:serine/threonine protein kinase